MDVKRAIAVAHSVAVACSHVSDEGCEVFCVTREDFLALVRGSWHVAQDLLAVAERHDKEKERRVNFRRTRDEVGGEEDLMDD